MNNKRNYFLEQQKIIQQADNANPPKLLLHSCCAPCSSAVLEYLSQYLSITVFYYNPNIFPEAEFLHRIDEQKRLIEQLPVKNKISFVERGWHPDRFYDAIKGLEHIREGGERCFACYRLRLEESAKLAKELECDYFTTTLSISPYKNAPKLNEIGEELAEKYGVKHLPSDFKKKNGYKRSVELSAEYGLYRQDYCGCVFSQKEREEFLNNG
ncbi:MAG: epoxyqueuosine reductase QueH [Oscillospiraceae bacterium]|nr:epoxyqueuosine reductase QueH [Oscillospiraceae bacterium]